MKFILSFFILVSSLLSLSTLPYASLNKQLLDAQEKLQDLSHKQKLLAVQKHYIAEYNKLTRYEKVILKDSNIDKQQAKTYLKKLRKLSAMYEELLSATRANTSKMINERNYISFLNIVDANLPKFFEKPSFTKSAIEYYEKNKNLQESTVMQREITYAKVKRESKEIIAAQNIQLIETKPRSVSFQDRSQLQTAPDTNMQLRYMKTAYLDPKLSAKRQRAFSPWMSKKEYQSRFDNGYFKRKNVYPAYIEMDKSGNRRVLEIPYEPRFYWSCTSGRLYNKFKKIHVGHTVNGKTLLSLHIQRVDGLAVYTGIWLSKEYHNRELVKLNSYGIYP